MKNRLSLEKVDAIKVVSAFSISVLLVVLFYFLYAEKSKFNETSYHNKVYEKLNKMRASAIGKNLVLINEITSKVSPKPKILLVYSGYDCSECLKKSFGLISDFEKSDKCDAIVIGSESNIGSDKIRFDYDGEIYYDAKSEIRRHLNYVLTPAFLLLDDKNIVRSAFWALPNNQERNKEEFAKFLIELDSLSSKD